MRTDGGKSLNRWAGAQVVLLASGPSLADDDYADVAEVKAWREAGSHRRVIAVCGAFLAAPWADAIYACDARWWRVYGDRAAATGSELWASYTPADSEWHRVSPVVMERIRHVELAEEPGMSRKRGIIHTGKNSGAQAIGLAHQWAWWDGGGFGALLGYDFHKTGGRSHCHGDHEGGLPNGGDMSQWISALRLMAIDLQDNLGVRLINASRGPILTCFDRLPIKETLNVRLAEVA